MSQAMNTGVFERYGQDAISERLFRFILVAVLLWGFVGTMILSSLTASWKPGAYSIIFLGIILPILGIILARRDNWFLSFIGYNMIVVPFGLILGPCLNKYSPDVIKNTFMITAMITAVMGCAGIMFPRIFEKMGLSLFLALLCLLGVRILQMFMPALQGLVWVDYLAAGIFSLYIGYDMYRANEIPKTVDNAIDIAIDLYLDILNLFLAILSSKSRD